MKVRSAMACGLLLHTLGCSGRDAETPGQETAVVARSAARADSLVATAPSGAEIWFTLSREGTAADGTRCIDRAIEIRRGESRVQVPLLYTGNAPEMVNDSTIRARLSDRCIPGDAYLVDLRSGRPVRER